MGRTLSRPCLSTSTASSPLRLAAMTSRAPYTMRSATDFLPSSMIIFMNLASSSEPNFGSGRISRFSARFLLDISITRQISGLRPLGAVLGTALAASAYAGTVQGPAHRVVAHTRQVLHTAAADQNDAVLLQVVAFTTDVGRHFIAVRQANAADLAQRGVRLLRRGRVNTSADAALLRRALQRRNGALFRLALARLANELVGCCHLSALSKVQKCCINPAVSPARKRPEEKQAG